MDARDAAASAPLAPEAPLTRAQAIAEVAAFLANSGVGEAREDARSLLLAAAELTRLELAMAPQAPLPEDAARRLSHYAARRAAREPVSRILGERGFWTLDLAVHPNVLDPRPDTETLIEMALSLIGERREEPLTILDLGAGSGAICCALLSELPAARAVAVDLSPDACTASAENLARCGLAKRASVVRGYWADSINGRFDLVVSNPPYVCAGDIPELDPEVRLYDPALALDGGADGLDAFRAIAQALPRLLADDGFVLFEVGAGQAVNVASLLGAQGFAIARIGRDMGGHERVVAAQRAAASVVTN